MDRSASPAFRTEIEFSCRRAISTRPACCTGAASMRLATAADEILPLRDPRVQQNQAYLSIIVLARVITRLGTLPDIDTQIIEGLFASDLDYLQRLYEQLNGGDEPTSRRSPAAARPTAMRRGGPPVWGKHEGLSVAALYEEMAFIAHHFHWSSETLLTMEHGERRRWCREISAINRALDGAPRQSVRRGL